MKAVLRLTVAVLLLCLHLAACAPRTVPTAAPGLTAVVPTVQPSGTWTKAPTVPAAPNTASGPTVRPPTATPQPTPTKDFQPSDDPVIFADPEGRVLRLDLSTGEQTALSDAGVFLSVDLLQPYTFGQHPAARTPVLSPDQRFLALPDPAGSGTWLIDLTGEESARKLIDNPAAVSWSPGSDAIAWTDGSQLYTQDISGGLPRTLASIDGLINVAWSPQGQFIALVAATTEQQITLSLVDVQSGDVKELLRARAMTDIGRGFDLAWTSDGSEVLYAPAMIGYDVEEQAVLPLLSPYVFAGERQTMYALSATPDQQRYAWPAETWQGQTMENSGRSLYTGQLMFFDIFQHITFDQEWASYAWTEDGHNLIVQEGTGDQAKLWRINPEFRSPVFYASAADTGAVLGTGSLIGTRSHLAQYHRQIAPKIELTPTQPPAPEYADVWSGIPMQEARMSIEHPMFWNYNWPPGIGDIVTTIANFEMIPGYYMASPSPEWFYAKFDNFTPSQGSPQEFLEQTVFNPQANAQWREITIDGRTGYRVRWLDRPTHEEVFIPFEDNSIVHIVKYPLKSDQDAVFDRMLQTAEWMPQDQWYVPYTPPTPDPTASAETPLPLAGTLPVPHWREGLGLFAITTQVEIARATTTRLGFYDPATLEETRSGLITLTTELHLNVINGDGSRLARAVGNTVEILDLNGLNEQGDPPVLGTFEAAGREIVKLKYAPDGKTLAVVSQDVRDDLSPALLEVFSTESLQSYGEWKTIAPPDLAFSPDSRWMASWHRTGEAFITCYSLDPASAKATEYKFNRRDVWDSAAFSPDSQVLAAASSLGEITFWNVQEQQLSETWGAKRNSAVTNLAYDPDNRLLAITGPEGIELRQQSDGLLVGFANMQVNEVAFVKQENALFLIGLDWAGAIQVWRIDP